MAARVSQVVGREANPRNFINACYGAKKRGWRKLVSVAAGILLSLSSVETPNPLNKGFLLYYWIINQA